MHRLRVAAVALGVAFSFAAVAQDLDEHIEAAKELCEDDGAMTIGMLPFFAGAWEQQVAEQSIRAPASPTGARQTVMSMPLNARCNFIENYMVDLENQDRDIDDDAIGRVYDKVAGTLGLQDVPRRDVLGAVLAAQAVANRGNIQGQWCLWPFCRIRPSQ